MILVCSQRGGAKNLAQHLMSPANEQVTLHELKGFASDNLHGAFNEAYAVSRGTRCKQFLFSLSLNPPAQENVPTSVFEDAIARIEEKLGLVGQPRAIVFHEKEARRHCHAVWSRIDAQEMKAVQLSHTKLRLLEISREIFIENNWKMPRGMMLSQQRDSKNYTLSEYQQAKRAGSNAKEIKSALQDCWAVSDSKAAYEQALKERGFLLCKGDQRGFLALNQQGEPFNVAKWTGIRMKDVRARLGSESELAPMEQVRAQLAKEMGQVVDRLRREQDEKLERFETSKRESIGEMSQSHAEAWESLEAQLEKRRQTELMQRQNRYRTGVLGLWDRLSGARSRIERRNEIEAVQAYERDRLQKDNLVFSQLEQRRALQANMNRQRETLQAQSQELQRDALAYKDLNPDMEELRQEFARAQSEIETRVSQDRDQSLPEPEQ